MTRGSAAAAADARLVMHGRASDEDRARPTHPVVSCMHGYITGETRIMGGKVVAAWVGAPPPELDVIAMGECG